MDDLEDQLRAEVARRMQQFSPSSDAPQRITTRVRRRHRRRQLLAGAALAGVAAVIVLAGLVVVPSDDEGGAVMIDDDNDRVRTADSTTTTTTTAPERPGEDVEPDQSTTSSSSPTTSSSTPSSSSTTLPPPEPTFHEFTPLSRRGIGPIVVGMTVAEAEAAAGVSIVVHDPGGSDFTCAQAEVAGVDVWFELELPGGPGSDPRAMGVIRTARGRVTEEEVFVGSTVADLDRIYGPPTRTVEHYFGGDEVRIYESNGYAYAATIYQGQVRYLTSGDPAWQDTPEGCQLNP